MSRALTTRIEYVKDENGDYVLDEEKVERFRKQHIRTMEKQNERVKNNPVLAKRYGICDPAEFAESMIRIHAHTLRLEKEIVL